MKKFASALLLIASMAVIALPASADTYSINFTGVGGQSTAGVYVYPYNFTVADTTNPGPSVNVSMMCIDFDREIFQPETWTATLVNITTPNAQDKPPFTTTQLDILAVLDSEIVHSGLTAQQISDLQFAAWSLTASSADLTKYAAGFNTSGEAADLLAAQNAVKNTTTSATNSFGQTVTYSDYSYFDPNDGSQSTGGDPQRFITYTGSGTPVPHTSPVPEPSSLMLLGTGVLGVASVARRRLLKA